MRKPQFHFAVGQARIVGALFAMSVLGTSSAVVATGAGPVQPMTAAASSASSCPTTNVYGSSKVPLGVTGKPQDFVVGPDVNCVRIDAAGGVGAPTAYGREPYRAGGEGGRESANFPVKPGEKLTVIVGNGGWNLAGDIRFGGYGGGGDGGLSTYLLNPGVSRQDNAAAGGGGSFVFSPSGSPLIVAGGGGGAGTGA